MLKCRGQASGIAQLRRLEHIRDLLIATGHDASVATLGIFSMSGLSDELRTAAAASDRVVLIGLDQLHTVPALSDAPRHRPPLPAVRW